MRLSWESKVTNSWEAKGAEFHYRATQVTERHLGDRYLTDFYETEWLVQQARSATGQVVKSARTPTLEGAFARAQAWEHGAS